MQHSSAVKACKRNTLTSRNVIFDRLNNESSYRHLAQHSVFIVAKNVFLQ